MKHIIQEIMDDLEHLMDEASIVDDQHSYDYIVETYGKWSQKLETADD